jgi:hypothetical protein
MWNLPVELLCDQHLRGEHSELHMFVGVIGTKTSLSGYLEKGQLYVNGLRERHEEVAQAMSLRSGKVHTSPLPEFEADPAIAEINNIDFDFNISDLESRCWLCSERIRVWKEQGKVPYLKDAIPYRTLGRKDDRRGTSKKTELKQVISYELQPGDNFIYQSKLFTIRSIMSSVNSVKLILMDNAGEWFTLDCDWPWIFEVIS